MLREARHPRYLRDVRYLRYPRDLREVRDVRESRYLRDPSAMWKYINSTDGIHRILHAARLVFCSAYPTALYGDTHTPARTYTPLAAGLRSG